MAGENSLGLRVLGVLAVLALSALPESAFCDLAARAMPPVVLCGSEGRLPDPTDCSYYVDCTNNTDGSGFTQIISSCPEGTYYNSCYGNCSYTQQPKNCSVPCDDAVTVSSDNPAVYVECISNTTGRYLMVTTCYNGQTADGEGGCNDEEDADCPVNKGTPGTAVCNGTYYYGDDKNCSVYYYCSGEGELPDTGNCSSDDQYFNISSHSCVEYQCTRQGVFADPANCAGYYQCTNLPDGTGYNKTHGQCPSGGHFDSSVGSCMMGDCTTVCPGTSRNFTCTSRGNFADPEKCNWYFYCDSTLQAWHRECPEGSHFDSAVGGCMMGACSKKLARTSLQAGRGPLRSVSSLSLRRRGPQIQF